VGSIWTITHAKLDREPSLEHEEEIVRVVVLVPYELALDLDDHEVVTVELTHRPSRVLSAFNHHSAKATPDST
jgi:hypothetical protein